MENKSSAIVIGIVGIVCLIIGLFSLFPSNQNNSAPDSSDLREDATRAIFPEMQKFIDEHNQKLITVPANVEWYDTKIKIPPGKTYEIIFSSGRWTNQQGTEFTQALGKYGDDINLLLVPGAYSCQLVGRVGKDVFVAGNMYRGMSSSGGELYLSINDRPNTYQDNVGSLEVWVNIK